MATTINFNCETRKCAQKWNGKRKKTNNGPNSNLVHLINLLILVFVVTRVQEIEEADSMERERESGNVSTTDTITITILSSSHKHTYTPNPNKPIHRIHVLASPSAPPTNPISNEFNRIILQKKKRSFNLQINYVWYTLLVSRLPIHLGFFFLSVKYISFIRWLVLYYFKWIGPQQTKRQFKC